MKNSFFNLLGSVIAFSLPFVIALLTGVENVVLAVLLAFFRSMDFLYPCLCLSNRKIL